jgi:hypothetical protein
MLGPWKGVWLGKKTAVYKVDNGKPLAPGMNPSFVMAYSIKLESKAQRSDLRLQAARTFTDEFMLADGKVTPLLGFVRFFKNSVQHWAISIEGGMLRAVPLSAVMAREGEVTEETQQELRRFARAVGLYTEDANPPLRLHAHAEVPVAQLHAGRASFPPKDEYAKAAKADAKRKEAAKKSRKRSQSC